jgi:hypothetical protein
MKTKNVYFSFAVLVTLVLSISFVSCKKDSETDTSSTVTKVYLLYKDSTVSTSYTYVREYLYNSSKKLSKVMTYLQGTLYTYDTLMYNVDGTINIVNTYSTYYPTIPIATKTYTHTSGKITSILETGSNANGAYSRTRTFTYSTSGYPQNTLVVYSLGSSESNPENFSNMVYVNGNIVSAHLTGIGPVVATTDVTAANPYLGMNIETESIDKLFNKNNMTQARLDTLTNDVFFTSSFTYANGRVATIHRVDDSGISDIWLTYKEY